MGVKLVILREEHHLRERERESEVRENCTLGSFMVYVLHQILLRLKILERGWE
jgi:hypothetical protein